MQKTSTHADGANKGRIAKMSKDALIRLGTGEVAYMKKVHAQDLARLFPDVPPVDNEIQLYALLNADGSPIALADSQQAVLENAFENELQMVSVH